MLSAAPTLSLSGLRTAGGDAKLTADGNLTLEEQTNLGQGDLFVDVAGDVTQLATGTITARGLGLMVDGTTVLTNAGNDVDEIAAETDGVIVFTDVDDLRVGTVTVDAVMANLAMGGVISSSEMDLVGVTTSNDDVKLTAEGNLTFEQQANLGQGDLFVDVAGNVSQTAAVVANGLGLMVDGATTLTNAGNDVDIIAADNGGELVFVDVDGLTVGSITVDGMTVSGIDTKTGDVKLTTGADLMINQVITAGSITPSNLFLNVAGNVTQTAAVVANGLGLMVDGTTTLTNAGNDVDIICLLYTSPSPRDQRGSRMPSSA